MHAIIVVKVVERLSTELMISYYFILISCVAAFGVIHAHEIDSFANLNEEEHVGLDCGNAKEHNAYRVQKLSYVKHNILTPEDWTFSTIMTTNRQEIDPFIKYQDALNKLLFGPKTPDGEENSQENIILNFRDVVGETEMISDPLAQIPSGDILRAELYQNKTSVHLPASEFMHRGHLYLRTTSDYMQTALNAFAILLKGNLEDVLRLPSNYVLKSAKTLAMMKIAKEKLVATWTVVKGDKDPKDIPPWVLEMYRPLFKYVNGREMARLNLSDPRILSYIGTHAELDRHQVGMVASVYIKMNKRWMEPRYLNLMNNLLCGVPMNFMRRAPENSYLQLNHQIFYHIHACDPLQRRFYYAMMTRTQALGKPYSWSARDLSRLGLLLSEVHGPDLATVNPEAMSGITAQVMLQIPAENLKYITEMQLRFISQKPLNILAKRLRDYQEEQRLYGKGHCSMNLKSILIVIMALTEVMK